MEQNSQSVSKQNETVDLLDIKNVLKNSGIFFSFNGYISQNVLGGMGDVIEAKLLELNVDNSIVNRVFAVFTEQMQNVMNYSKQKSINNRDEYESLGISVVGFSEQKGKYFIGSGNFIDENDVKSLSEKLDKINSMSQTDLKKYYKAMRRSGDEAHHRGAGLGFIEMAKRATEPLQYRFIPSDQDEKFFQLFVYI
jgi:hypothetical protein